MYCFFQAEDGIRDYKVTGVQTCALPIFKQVLELHTLNPDEPYYLAFMLVGAYQEVMGNNHNLFGAPHEAHIHIDEEGFLIKKVIKGTTVGAAAERAR